MTNLKPCPFCGKRVIVYYSSATKGYYAVHEDEQNSECIILMPLLINGHNLFVCLSDAIEAWNRRINDEHTD